MMKCKIKHGRRILTLIFAITIPLLVGVFSAFLTAEDMNIYKTIASPPLAPPSWLFPIVWTILYMMMGLASYYIYISDTEPEQKRKALLFYAAQLAMNMFWSTLFFTYGLYLLSLLWLIGMWVLILICTIQFYKIRRTAGWMMGILLLWTTFAAYLNLAYYVISIRPAPAIA